MMKNKDLILNILEGVAGDIFGLILAICLNEIPAYLPVVAGSTWGNKYSTDNSKDRKNHETP